MILLEKLRLRDAITFVGSPSLRKKVRLANQAGLATLLDYQRLAMLLAAVRHSARLDGDIIEFGTFQGGSAGVILQEISASKTLHVCDSFEGMPDVSSHDNFHKKGDFHDTSARAVHDGLLELGRNFEMHIGFFDQTIASMCRRDLKFALAHIDVDLYDSVHDCLAYCYPRMAPGGIIILDDYGAPTCIGGKQAADEFFSGKAERVVPLSQPANGCVIGGGNAFDLLSRYCGPPLGNRLVSKRVFRQRQIR